MSLESPRSTVFSFTHRRPIDFGLSTAHRRRDAVRKIINALHGLISGNQMGDDVVIQANSVGALAPAAGVFILSGGSGSIGVTLNGVALTVTWATSDQASADAFVAFFNASVNTLVAGLAAAGQAKKATATFASLTVGSEVLVMGYKFRAVSAAQANTPLAWGTFVVGGGNTTDAAALAAAINATPGLNQRYYAYNAAAVLNILPLFTTAAPASDVVVQQSGTGLTIVQLAASPTCAIYALKPGIEGNCQTIAASGTGVTLANGVARLVGGSPAAATRIQDQFGGGAM